MADGRLLDLAEVTKSYAAPGGEEIRVLRGVNLSVSAGESVAVTGPSGSGKSTLLNIMGLLDRPTSGRILLDGRDVSALAEAEAAAARAKEIGFVFQMHQLLQQCGVLENVLVPTLAGYAPPDAEARARRLLERVGLGHRLSHPPGMLSGGECQRAAVVRAFVNRPRLVLADEPTGSLDREGAESLARLLCELNREEGTALVVVTHSAPLAERMGRRLVLRDGVLEPLG